MPEITTTIRRVVYKKESGKEFWLILDTEAGTCKGCMPFVPEPGLRFRLTGKIKPYNGSKEFQFTRAIPDVPIDPRQKLNYLCEIAKGIGPKAEEMIWDELGKDWEDKDRLLALNLSASQRKSLAEAFTTLSMNAAQVNAVSYLMGHGATYNMAEAAWAEWREKTISNVVGNCYRLANLPNYGFTHVDVTVRKHFQIKDTDPRRVQASLYYAIRQLREMGNTAVSWTSVLTQAKKVSGIQGPLITKECKAMLAAGFLVGWKNTMMIANKEDYDNEATIWEWIK